MARTGKRFQKPLAYPEPEVIPDHLWISFKLSLDGCGGDRTLIRTAIRSFCTIFGISPATVEQRLKDEDKAAAEIEAGVTLH